MEFQDEKHGYAPRMNDEGIIEKRPAVSASATPYPRPFRLGRKQSKISDAQRRLIFNFCERTNQQKHFVYLLHLAEQRAMEHSKLLKRSAAARNAGMKDFSLVEEALLQRWIDERDQPSLF